MWSGALVLLYPIAYAVARGSGQLVHFTQCVHYTSGEESRTYHVVRSCSFGDRHPTDRSLTTVSLLDRVFGPLASLELRLRGIPEFERVQ